MRRMAIEPLRNRRDCRRALREIESVVHAKRNTIEGDRLDLLVTLVEAWEARHLPLEACATPPP
jgi:HTH-type transcriptional regulator/antitoxin HigA